MNYIKIKTENLPKIAFAHVFESDSYKNVITAKSSLIEISFVEKGELCYENNGEEKRIGEYGLCCNLYNADTRVYSMNFHEHHTVAIVLDFDFAHESEGENVLFLRKFLSLQKRSKIHDLIDEIIKNYTLYPENSLYHAGLCYQILSEYSVISKANGQEYKREPTFYASKVKKYVYNNLNRPISQREIAKHLNITPEYLCSVFKKETGGSLIKFINQTKLSRIRNIMQKEKIKLNEAAYLMGYSDPNYVSKLFKKYYGFNISEKEKI